MNLIDLFDKEAERMAQTIKATYTRGPWTQPLKRRLSRYVVREYYSGQMNGTGLYTSVDNGAKFLLRPEPVKPEKPGGFVYGIWDRDEKKLLTIWPNQQTAEGVLRLMQ